MQITGTVVKPTSFWKVIGITSTTLTQSATAVASGGMVDVMLSLDLSKSMDMGGSDLTNLQAAVIAFINQMQITSGDRRGTQLGIARFAGAMLVAAWGRAHGCTDQHHSHPDPDTDSYTHAQSCYHAHAQPDLHANADADADTDTDVHIDAGSVHELEQWCRWRQQH